MSNKPMPWIKQYPTRLYDVRLASLSDRQQLRYWQLYMLAGHLNANGSFIQDGKELSVSQIAFLLRVNDAKLLEKDMAALKKARLIKANGHGPFIAEFKDEQINWIELQRSNRERQKRFKQSRKDNALVTRDTPVDNGAVTPLDKDKDKDKDLIIIIVADAFKMYEEKIGKLTNHIRGELTKLFNSNPEYLEKAILSAADGDQGKHNLKYIKGAFNNLKAGTQKPEPRTGHATKAEPKKKLNDKQVKL